MNPVATSDAAFRGGACPTPEYTIAYTGNYTTSADANSALTEAADIRSDNRDAIDACRKTAATSKQPVRCTVKIRQSSPEGETAATPVEAATRSQKGA